MSKALKELRGPVRAVFTDLDGTLASGGRLTQQTMSSLFDLFREKIPVLLVTGRPAGWGHALLNLFPFAGAITENGGVSMILREAKTYKFYGVAEEELASWRTRLEDAVAQTMLLVPEARLSEDTVYRELDIAIDWKEEVSLSAEQAERMATVLREKGFTASRSSVHINVAPPTFNKYTACQVMSEKLKLDLDTSVYVGDSLNDVSAFGGFEKSVGVANVRKRWDEMEHKPKFITEASEGAGFAELTRHILSMQ